MRGWRKMGGLIFYYISDTHNIQKRQAGENTQKKIVLHYTVFMFTFILLTRSENILIYFITVKYIIECLMRMQIYQLNLMCFLGENLSPLIPMNVRMPLESFALSFICCHDAELKQIREMSSLLRV